MLLNSNESTMVWSLDESFLTRTHSNTCCCYTIGYPTLFFFFEQWVYNSCSYTIFV